MSQKNFPLHELLMQLATTVRDLCQRRVDKNRLLDNINLDVIVEGLLREHGLEQDFDQQLLACVDAMSQPDTVGRTVVFERPDGELRMRQVDTRRLLDTPIERYEMVLFDGGHTHGDRWKHLFFPAQRLHHFVHELP